ncbi:MAG: phospholipase D-like domain-containing protein [Synechococcales bacterium]|nr:phospholipase D-like domain-containing protein [Synechococcales bacterium]
MSLSVWILSILGFLVALAVIFLVFTLYLGGAFRRHIVYRLKQTPKLSEPRFPQVVTSLSDSLTTSGHLTGFWVEANEIFAARLDAIRQARHFIHFETFFMTSGKRADDFAGALIQKAQAGVKVLFIADHYGAHGFPVSYWRRLQRAGVEVRFFHPFTWRSPLDYLERTHRKLLLIDGEQALIGGAGISDHWDGRKSVGETAPWLDFEIGLRGPIVSVLEGTFMQHWTYVGGIADVGDRIIQAAKPEASSIYVIPGDPSYRDSSVTALFHISFQAAQERIWLTSPYLLPNEGLQKDLIDARQRGVDVRILTMGHYNDKSYVYYASRERYRPLLEAGIQLYEYQPSMLHAKLMVVDGTWLSLGSANLDPRSLFRNDELNLSMRDADLSHRLETFFLRALEASRLITIPQWERRPYWQRLIGRTCLVFQRQL